jgi:glycosyltransferase involved in cell wall biosynthesis
LEQNEGAASTRNVGWSKVTHPYIAFLDSDDSWFPKKIEIQFGYMHLNPHVGLSGHLYTWSIDKAPSLLDSDDCKVKKISASELILKSYFPTPSVMVKSDVALRFRESQRHSEDALLWQELALAKVEIVRLEIPLVRLHKAPYGDGGLSAQLWAMQCAELNNFRIHYKNKNASIGILIIAILFSVVKFLRRLLISAIRTSERK